MFSYRRVDKIIVLVAACGSPIGWAKSFSDENLPSILNFLDSLSGGDERLLPSFIAYDRACTIIPALVDEDPSWLKKVTWICDAFHFAGHSKNDVLCRKYCDPAPLDGSQPDLVTPFVEEGGEGVRVFRRAFNTEVWIPFGSREMSHFDFFLRS